MKGKKKRVTLCEGGKERDLSYENKRKNGKNEKRAKRFLSLGGKNEHNSKCK